MVASAWPLTYMSKTRISVVIYEFRNNLRHCGDGLRSLLGAHPKTDEVATTSL
jgi:hypothetical protein